METQVIEVKPVQTDQIEKQLQVCTKHLNAANQIVIQNQPEYESTVSVLQEIKQRAKDLEAERRKITGPIDAAKAAVQELFRRPQNILAEAEKIVKDKMLKYTDEQERIRQEEQAEKDRIAAKEKAKKEEQERKLREKEEEKRKEAAKLAAKGNVEEAKKAQEAADRAAAKADERAAEAASVQAETVAPKVDKVAGVAYREDWSAEVVDFAKLPDDYKLPDMVKLNKQARATKDTVRIPGVVFKSKKTPIIGGAK